MDPQTFRPTVFVAMPYGLKLDPKSRHEIDFDQIWDAALRPAIESVGFESIRADEERLGGFVHLAMFERLLLAEIVVADLTLASPNVMYELGIRHATRPRATISVFARTGQLPFDLSPIRALPYRLDKTGRLTGDDRIELIENLGKRLSDALTETAPDSPLFQLIQQYPGVTLSHDVTETFQRRAQQLTAWSNEIRSAPSQLSRLDALSKLRAICGQLLAASATPTELLIDLILAYRDIEAFTDMITLANQLPEQARQHPAVRQLTAFALNRRGQANDDIEAIRILEHLIDEDGPTPETMGLLGRVHKDRHRQYETTDPLKAEAALESAIEAYEAGFRADMRDYYPGINAITLLMMEGSDRSYERARELSPVVAFSIADRRGLQSKDYWDLASVLELSIVNLDMVTAKTALKRMLYIEPLPWQRETTSQNLRRLRSAHEARGIETGWITEIIKHLTPDTDGE